MIITNKLGLPAPLVSLAQEEYESAENEYRVTSLLRGVRETILEKRHRHEVERDVADMIWLLFGKAVHGILEQHAEQDDELKEMRIKVPVCGGLYILSGSKLSSPRLRRRSSCQMTNFRYAHQKSALTPVTAMR